LSFPRKRESRSYLHALDSRFRTNDTKRVSPMKYMKDWQTTNYEKYRSRALNRAGIRYLVTTLVVIVSACLTFYQLFLSPPSGFPKSIVFSIKKGETLSQISDRMKDTAIIRRSFSLINYVILLKGETKVVAGDYYFEKPLSVMGVGERITKGSFNLVPLKITFPEGLSNREYASIAEPLLPQFDSENFIRLVQDKEGYLFPDTYLFISNSDEKDVADHMTDNFNDKISVIQDQIDSSPHTLGEIITMASIIEEEAVTEEARKIVSGILWKRLENGMLLQVDSTFKYINGKSTYEITADDLKIESPYNTHKYAGLPPTPISNPGMESILAALNPTETEYFYFLSDREGNMYYAEDFEDHKKNKAKYFDN